MVRRHCSAGPRWGGRLGFGRAEPALRKELVMGGWLPDQMGSGDGYGGHSQVKVLAHGARLLSPKKMTSEVRRIAIAAHVLPAATGLTRKRLTPACSTSTFSTRSTSSPRIRAFAVVHSSSTSVLVLLPNHPAQSTTASSTQLKIGRTASESGSEVQHRRSRSRADGPGQDSGRRRSIPNSFHRAQPQSIPWTRLRLTGSPFTLQQLRRMCPSQS
jgi:hypothetical protein